MMSKPRVLILHVSGTNRDRDVAEALTLAGGEPEIVHVNQLRTGERDWVSYQMLVLPGGFAYGDALGAGRLTALDLNTYFADEVREFVNTGKLVIGICNGFQALVKAGILPGNTSGQAMTSDNEMPPVSRHPSSTLTRNARDHFECRWVTLLPNVDSPCVFTRGLTQSIYCPVAHGEGNFIPANDGVLNAMRANHQIALTYATVDPLLVTPRDPPPESWNEKWDRGRDSLADNHASQVAYPANPNGSVAGIAGVCNLRGNVLGLMPHPENHIHFWQHPRWTRGERGGQGLALFENAIQAMQAQKAP